MFSYGEHNGVYVPVYQMIGNKWVEIGGQDDETHAMFYCEYWNKQRQGKVLKYKPASLIPVQS